MGSWKGLLGTRLDAEREKKMREIEKMKRVLKEQRKNGRWADLEGEGAPRRQQK